MRLADDADEFMRIAPGMIVVVDPIADADAIEAGAKIEKDPSVAAGLRRPAQQPANDVPWVAVKRQPPVTFGLLVENA
jgi:hypothetical protein